MLNPMLATKAHEKVSKNYKFLSTIDMVTAAAYQGWFYKSDRAARSRIYQGYQKHVVYLNNPAFKYDDFEITMLIVNSHIGSSTLKVLLGFFRACCENQVNVNTLLIDNRVRHQGNAEEQAREIMQNVNKQAVYYADIITRLKSIKIENPTKFAQDIISKIDTLKEKNVNPEAYLVPRRIEDRGSDAWTIANIIQEHIIKGGIRYVVKPSIIARIKSAILRRPLPLKIATTRRITSIDNTIKFNQVVFDAALKLAA